MATTIINVRPGDVITADAWNLIVARIAALEAAGTQTPANQVEVPRLIGQSLGSARTALTLPTVGLNLGLVLDAAGSTVNPNAAGSAALRVIGQSPGPPSRVLRGSSVDIVVGANTSGGGGGTPAGPSIIRFESSPGNTVVEGPAGSLLDIVGEGFNQPLPGNNSVFFAPAATPLNRITATIQNVTATRITVQVPTTVAGTPTNPAAAALATVVTVETDGRTAQLAFGIRAPLPVPDPSITGSSLLVAALGTPLTLTGSDFINGAGTAQVGFLQAAESITNPFPAGRFATPSAISAGSLTVTVPNTPEMLSIVPVGPGVSRRVVLRRADGRVSNLFIQDFRR